MRSVAGLLVFAAVRMCWADTTEYPFDRLDWEITAAEYDLIDHLGERAMMIKGGIALLPDVEHQDAVVEFDMAVGESRGFAGLLFRYEDAANYEHIYIRPHQSGNPDANQYTPVFNGVSAWQLYHGEGYGAPVEYRHDEWMHIRVIYQGDVAALYIDSDEPVLVVNDLKRDTATGRIGVNAANFAPAWFANVSVSPVPDGYSSPAAQKEQSQPVTGTVMSWQVSQSFASEKAALEAPPELTWHTLSAEPNGTTNLAQVPHIANGHRSLIARVLVDSEAEQRKGMSFGYSDRVLVLVNGVPVYAGDNTYMSRDYRYLGTIGYFDSLEIPLREGRNEIRLIVSESFGGWGVQARFADLDGISLPSPP